MEQIAFKRGTSFAINATYTPGPTAPGDLANVDIASQVRKPDGTLVATLAIVKAPDNMSFRMTAPEGTRSWPYNTLTCDIKLTHGGVTGFTETFNINVQREITV